MGNRKSFWRFVRHHNRPISISAILLMAMAFGLGKYYLTKQDEERQTRLHFDQMSHNAFAVISAAFSVAKAYPQLMAQHMFSWKNASDLEGMGQFFTEFADSSGHWKSTFISSMALAKRVRPEERPSLESRFNHVITQWNGTDLAPAVNQTQDYFPLLFLAPLAGNEPAILTDTGIDPGRRPVIEEMGRDGTVTFTSRFLLVQFQQFGVAMQAPLYKSAAGAITHNRSDEFWGFVSGALVLDNVLTAGLLNAEYKGMDVILFDLGAPPNQQYLTHFADNGLEPLPLDWLFSASASDLLSARSDMLRTWDVPMGERDWLVVVRARPGYLHQHQTFVPATMLILTLISSVIAQTMVIAAWVRAAAIRRRRRKLLAAAAAAQASNNAGCYPDAHPPYSPYSPRYSQDRVGKAELVPVVVVSMSGSGYGYSYDDQQRRYHDRTRGAGARAGSGDELQVAGNGGPYGVPGPTVVVISSGSARSTPAPRVGLHHLRSSLDGIVTPRRAAATRGPEEAVGVATPTSCGGTAYCASPASDSDTQDVASSGSDSDAGPGGAFGRTAGDVAAPIAPVPHLWEAAPAAALSEGEDGSHWSVGLGSRRSSHRDGDEVALTMDPTDAAAASSA